MKKKTAIKTIKKSVRLKVIILLGLMLTFNTLAWFIYSATVSNSIVTKVRAWKIEFDQDDQVTQYINFEIDDLYPGMPDYDNFINVVNYGETAATLTYELVSIKILGNTYTDSDYTSAQLENMLLNNYPFKVVFNLTNGELTPGNGTSDFSLNVNWPFESGDDEEDTRWGHDSYSFKLANPEEKQILINVKLTATQVNP